MFHSSHYHHQGVVVTSDTTPAVCIVDVYGLRPVQCGQLSRDITKCVQWVQFSSGLAEICKGKSRTALTLNIPSLSRQRCLPSWGPRTTPWVFFNFSTV
jgi:hypothetical protein